MKNFYVPFFSKIREISRYFNNIGVRLALLYALGRFLFLLSPYVSSVSAISLEILILLLKNRAVSDNRDIDRLSVTPRAISPQGLSYYLHDPSKGVEVIIDDGIMVIEHD